MAIVASLGLAAASASSTIAVAEGGERLTSAVTEPLPGRTEDPRFDMPVDLVIESEAQWEQHVAAAIADPARFDGMVVGVVLDPVGAVTNGGDAAVAADKKSLDAAGLSLEDPLAPPCARDLAVPPPDGGFGTWLICPGSGSFAGYFVPRPAVGEQAGDVASLREAIAIALDELRAPLLPQERLLGYRSVLEGWPAESVEAAHLNEQGHLTIDVDRSIAVTNLASLSESAAFSEQLLRTALSFPSVQAVSFTIDGSCLDFAELQDSTECALLTAGDLQERLG